MLRNLEHATLSRILNKQHQIFNPLLAKSSSSSSSSSSYYYYYYYTIHDELLSNFGRKSLGLIYTFKCEITKLPWQPSIRLSAKDGDEVLEFYE